MAPALVIAGVRSGVGKTTIAVNLACALATGNNVVAVVDADVQATATVAVVTPPARRENPPSCP